MRDDPPIRVVMDHCIITACRSQVPLLALAGPEVIAAGFWELLPAQPPGVRAWLLQRVFAEPRGKPRWRYNWPPPRRVSRLEGLRPLGEPCMLPDFAIERPEIPRLALSRFHFDSDDLAGR